MSDLDRLRGHHWPSTIGLLILHGSRARGDAAEHSDWDFGVLPMAPADTFDLAEIVVELADAVGTDAIDVVDLRVASALLRYRAAKDGVALLERPAGEFLRFREEAVGYWCDAGPVILAAQADVLADLG